MEWKVSHNSFENPSPTLKTRIFTSVFYSFFKVVVSYFTRCSSLNQNAFCIFFRRFVKIAKKARLQEPEFVNLHYNPSTFCFLCLFFETVNCNLFICSILWDFFQKGTFGLLFFAVIRFSPPSPKAEAVKRKAKAKNIRRIRKSRSLIFWLRLSEAKPRQVNSWIE